MRQGKREKSVCREPTDRAEVSLKSKVPSARDGDGDGIVCEK